MVEMLGGSGYAGFGLDGIFQRADGGICWDFEREEIVVVLRRRSYAYSDTPLKVVSSCSCNREPTQTLLEVGTWPCVLEG